MKPEYPAESIPSVLEERTERPRKLMLRVSGSREGSLARPTVAPVAPVGARMPLRQLGLRVHSSSINPLGPPKEPLE